MKLNERIKKIEIAFKEMTAIEIETRIMKKGNEHRPSNLAESNQGVYVFYDDDNFFKVGKAGGKSQARWNSHHYCLDEKTPSTLPKSIKKNVDIFKKYFSEEKHSEIDRLSKNNIRQWIQDNLSRIEMIIPNNLNPNDMNLLEAMSIYEFNPLFEGKKESDE